VTAAQGFYANSHLVGEARFLFLKALAPRRSDHDQVLHD